ncbi:MAG: RNA methyltransferase [Chloroflexota bacterium]|nr:RNA methyltransferase [Chloroflexota bacterium]MDE2909341.1 RNA methyltransferase [Chloroflexota bacterium]
MPADPTILEGALSIQAALEAGFRDIHQILIDERKRSDRRISWLRRKAQSAGASVSFVSRATIEASASGKSHGGIIALVGERRFRQLGELLPEAEPAFIVMLDGIEDPYNFAGVIRALYAAGADGVVMRPRNWTSATALVGRASAGAIERLPLAIAATAAEAAEFYRGHNLVVACTAKAEPAEPLYDVDLTAPLFLLIGGERRGVTRSFLRNADWHLRVPYGREFEPSLGTVGAASVIAFEVSRQRRCTRL